MPASRISPAETAANPALAQACAKLARPSGPYQPSNLMPSDQPFPADITRDITGVILAGGRATRLGGVDKGLVTLAGRPLIEHVLARLHPQVGEICINANRERDRYAAYGHVVIDDGRDDFAGPLAGILAGLRAAHTPDILIVPVDIPALPLDLADRLKAVRGDRPAACVHDGERLQPLCALLSVTVLETLENFLYAGGRKVHVWMQSLSPAIADYADQPDAFLNLNTPEAFTALNSGVNATGVKGPA